MAFSDQQVRKLKSRLKPQHVRLREIEGQNLPYLEGWHVVAEANRIFGFDGWDRETVSNACVWTKQLGSRYCAAYVARVRITVKAGEERIIREGSGAGESSEATPGQAHDRASKAAETDATKRALMTFGNCFGLTLYAAMEAARRTVSTMNGAEKPVRERSLAVSGPSADAIQRGEEAHRGDGSLVAGSTDGTASTSAHLNGKPSNGQDEPFSTTSDLRPDVLVRNGSVTAGDARSGSDSDSDQSPGDRKDRSDAHIGIMPVLAVDANLRSASGDGQSIGARQENINAAIRTDTTAVHVRVVNSDGCPGQGSDTGYGHSIGNGENPGHSRSSVKADNGNQEDSPGSVVSNVAMTALQPNDEAVTAIHTAQDLAASEEPPACAEAGTPAASVLAPAKGHWIEDAVPRPAIDKSVLAIAEPRRVRDPEHLLYVAEQPCMICDRQPCEAHHLRYMQPRALGRKSSDAYTVPLCALHHRELHAKGKERAWWIAKGRDPVAVADQLWRQTTRQRSTRDRAD